MRGRLPFRTPRIWVVAFAVMLSACTDLGAVREWSDTSMQAAQFNEIVTTYQDTPVRLAAYDPKRSEAWNAQANARRAQAEALKLQLALIAEYMGALAALSADSAADFSTEIDGLTGSLKKTGQASEATIGAAGGLVKTLLNAGAQAWQRDKVGDLIEQANQPLQGLLTGELRSIVDTHFRRDLENEAILLDLYFENLLKKSEASPTAKAALNEWFILRKAENARRSAALDAYLGVLEKIAQGHQKLFDSRNDLDAKQLVKDLYRLAKEIRDNVKQLIIV
ncbi:MAG: hypothetical protein QNJ06_04565 [Kiloniellales bacterium]|nr:hypothetical protein [Kiloniellales bacterium]MDJ0969151.1 hypothetical protein [Kiloniellales bacterium]MDJ0979974.1 hypothetical protein [Kiloniellales bacterium]